MNEVETSTALIAGLATAWANWMRVPSSAALAVYGHHWAGSHEATRNLLRFCRNVTLRTSAVYFVLILVAGHFALSGKAGGRAFGLSRWRKHWRASSEGEVGLSKDIHVVSKRGGISMMNPTDVLGCHCRRVAFDVLIMRHETFSRASPRCLELYLLPAPKESLYPGDLAGRLS